MEGHSVEKNRTEVNRRMRRNDSLWLYILEGEAIKGVIKKNPVIVDRYPEGMWLINTSGIKAVLMCGQFCLGVLTAPQ